MSTQAQTAAAWWRGLQPYRSDGSRNPHGDRAALARLRRANLVEAMDEAATFALFADLCGTKPEELEAVALCAGVLAAVRETDTVHPARALGPTQTGKPETAAMHPLRFRRLVEATDAADRLTALRRAVLLGGRRLNVRLLAQACLDWSDITRRNWIFNYYNAGAAAPDRAQAVSEETDA